MTTAAQAALRLPKLFSDGMVMQRNAEIPIWGWAEAGQSVTLTLQPADSKGKGKKVYHTAVADNIGKWMLKLPAMRPQGPLVLEVKCGEEVLTVSDIWVGDVWLCSGQSNIDTNIERVYPQYPREINNDSTDRVRLFKVENEAVLEGPRSDVRSSGWKTLSKKNAWKFSALGYFLGKQMQAKTGVVQGVIQCSWGGTPIESWIPRDSVQRFDASKAREAVYYTDSKLRQAALEANRQAGNRWNALLNETDPGVRGNWTAANYDDSKWQKVQQDKLPVRAPFNGSFWMRQHIHIDAAHAGQEALLLLGTLIDADFSYVNGKLVGQTGYQYPPRRYTIPQGLLHEGDNVITIRFVNRGMAPKFVQGKPYLIRWADNTTLPLDTEWLVHEGASMPNQPSMPTGFQNMAAAAYNGMLLPLAPYAVAGMVWYQGESNTDRPVIYEAELHSLMNDWRQQFQQSEMPFVVVQLANYMEPSTAPQETGWARLRESQRRAAVSDPRAELAVAIDLGEANDIHPLRKSELAERVGLAFDKLVFGKRVLLSPQPLSAQSVDKNMVVITFDQPVTASQGFEIAEEGGPFHNVNCTAKGNQVTLYGQGNRVRYAWKNNPIEADCRAKDSRLPATPFEIEITK
ncbi:MAG: sialate O-acetylesterase [Bacteroidaceae bacterium]|nr:sialate O-acetylesterase [Bacteroidaceae bacterium]